MTATPLERVIRSATARRFDLAAIDPLEHCELCAEPVANRHRHLFDVRGSQLLCVCYPCSVLFQRDAASEGHYRLVPERRVPVTDVSPATLGVPVGLAFFVETSGGAVLAHYPSPAGATRWQVDPQAWTDVVRECPPLGELAPDVEALLVNTARGNREAWIVPISDCYRLVAVVRREWKGLSGGTRVWPAIEEFFDELRRADGPHQGR